MKQIKLPKNETRVIPSDKQLKLIDASVRNLFISAKEKDEAEYICAIKYFKGFNYLHVKTPVNELYETVTQAIIFSQKYLKNPDFIAKHLSFVYCQIFEATNWLDLIINLLSILDGKCVNPHPFKKNIKTKEKEERLDDLLTVINSDKNTQEKIKLILPIINSVANPNTAILTKLKRIKKLSKKFNLRIGEVLITLYDNDFRNDFTHSQYVMYKNHLYLFKAQKNISFDNLFGILLSVLNVFLITANLVEEEIDDIVDKQSKTFTGKCGTVTVEIDGDNIKHSSKMLCANL